LKTLCHVFSLSFLLVGAACSRQPLSISPERNGVNDSLSSSTGFPTAPAPLTPPQSGTGPVTLTPVPESLQQIPFGGPYLPNESNPTQINPVGYSAPSTALLSISAWPGYDFGAAEIEKSVSQTFILANFGRAPAIGIDLGFSVAEVTAFTFVQSNCGQVLQPMTSCIFEVKFSPTQAGEILQTLKVSFFQSSGVPGYAYRALRGEGLPLPTLVQSSAYHTCAAIRGAAKCWGHNYYGELGNGTNANSNVPVDVVGLSSGVTQVATSLYTSCAIVRGGLKCWGYNGYGEVGTGTGTPNTNVPVDVPGMTSGVTSVTGGHHFMCAVQNGAAKCWGYGGYSNLGNGSAADRHTPTQVTGLTEGVTKIQTKHLSVCALQNGAAKCWGYNGWGQLGNGTTTSSLVPVQVAGLEAAVSDLSAGSQHMCAIQNGAAKCWGYNGYGSVGNNQSGNYFTGIQAVQNVDAGATLIAAGENHSCAIVDNQLKCWGYNGYGQLGIGSTTQNNAPVATIDPGFVPTSLAVGFNHTCVANDVNMKCWGYNAHGQLGEGTWGNRTVPTAVNTGF